LRLQTTLQERLSGKTQSGKTARKNRAAATVASQRKQRNSTSGTTESIINSAATGDEKREQTPLVVRRTNFSPTQRKI